MLIALERAVGYFRAFVVMSILKVFLYTDFFNGLNVCLGKGSSIIVKKGGRIKYKSFASRKNLSICVDGGVLDVGDEAFFNNGCSINVMDNVWIGKNVLFGEGVKIYDHDHVWDERFGVNEDEFKKSAVYIGSNCWIGTNSIILKGVNLVDNVVIAAGSTVSMSINAPGIYVCNRNIVTKIR